MGFSTALNYADYGMDSPESILANGQAQGGTLGFVAPIRAKQAEAQLEQNNAYREAGYIPGQAANGRDWNASQNGGWWEIGDGKRLVYDKPVAATDGEFANAKEGAGYRIYDPAAQDGFWTGVAKGFAPIASVIAPALSGPVSGLVKTGAGVVADQMAAGALTGAATSAMGGGNPLTGAVTGAAGGAVGGFASQLEGGTNFVGPVQNPGSLSTSDIVRAGGTALVSAASGGNPLVSGASSLAGSAATNATGSPLAGRLTSAATGIIGSNLSGSNGTTTTLPAVTAGQTKAADNINDWLHSLPSTQTSGTARFSNAGLINR